MTEAFIPEGGLPTWSEPNADVDPVSTVAAGHHVDVIERTDSGWAKVRFDNGWEGWVDGRRLIEPGRNAPPSESVARIKRRQLLGGVLVVVAVASGAAAYLATRSGDDQVATTRGDITATSASSQTQTSADEPADSGSSEDASATTDANESADPQEDSLAYYQFSDELIEEALAAIDPPGTERTASEDTFATIALLAEVGPEAGELGIDLSIRTGRRSILLIETDDTSPLVASAETGDTSDGEQLMLSILNSEVVESAGIDWVVMQHRGTDESGPFTATFTMRRSTLLESPELDAADVSVQVSRP